MLSLTGLPRTTSDAASWFGQPEHWGREIPPRVGKSTRVRDDTVKLSLYEPFC